MTRIIAGDYGGRRIKVPAGDSTRPTADRVREALFSSLQSMFGSLTGLRVLDLFAGSGALGLEAVSRGAASADLVEVDRKAAAVIRSNIEALGATQVKLLSRSAQQFTQVAPHTPYDVVLLDPPYAFAADELAILLRTLAAPEWTTRGAVVVVERAKRDQFSWPAPYRAVRDKKYGDTILWYGHPHD